jgi:YfiH family protein
VPGLFHAVFTRVGGVSPPPFYGLNVAHGLGDDGERVGRNRRILAAVLGGPRLAFCRQVHGTGVHAVDGDLGGPVPEADALMTDRVGVGLVIQVADCQAVLLYDPVHRVVANVHAGWRGGVAGILGATVQAMSARYGTAPPDLLAAVGPSLGRCCAEFVHYRSEIPPAYWPYKDDRHRFDFWAISRDQLLEAGLSGERIQIGGICTRCRTDRFFSYRGEGITGRFAVVVGLKP